MVGIRFENLFEKMLFVLSLTILIQLMFTIGASHQKSLLESSSSNSKHLTPLYNEFNQNAYQSQQEEDEEEDKPNRLTLSNNLLNYLMKKFAENPKLQEYLKVLKKKTTKKNDIEEEDPLYDYHSEQTKFRF